MLIESGVLKQQDSGKNTFGLTKDQISDSHRKIAQANSKSNTQSN